MKKIIFPVLLLLCCGLFSGCIKNLPYATTPNPSMNVTIGNYTFTTTTVYPATVKQQVNDTSVSLVITGNEIVTREKIILTINNYKGKSGEYSIVMGQASANYIHATGNGNALGGNVVINKITNDSIIGYFNFDTVDGLSLVNGTFTVPTPNYVANP